MKLKTLLISGAVLALAVPTAAQAANTRDAATGGGQAFFDSREPSGAGDTVAFTAHRAKGAGTDSDAATGQIQVNRRGEANAIKFHGTISCLVVNGSQAKEAPSWAYMSGESRARKGATPIPFELFVEDGGSGPQERNDHISLFVGDETTQNDSDNEDRTEVCGFSDFNPDDAFEMFRGNVQVRNRSTDEDQEPDPGTAALTTTLALF